MTNIGKRVVDLCVEHARSLTCPDQFIAAFEAEVAKAEAERELQHAAQQQQDDEL